MKIFNVGDTVFFNEEDAVIRNAVRRNKRRKGTVKLILLPESTGVGFTHYVIHEKGWPDDDLVMKADHEVYDVDSDEWESFKSLCKEVKLLYETNPIRYV
jgi:hypothetical protein